MIFSHIVLKWMSWHKVKTLMFYVTKHSPKVFDDWDDKKFLDEKLRIKDVNVSCSPDDGICCAAVHSMINVMEANIIMITVMFLCDKTFTESIWWPRWLKFLNEKLRIKDSNVSCTPDDSICRVAGQSMMNVMEANIITVMFLCDKTFTESIWWLRW